MSGRLSGVGGRRRSDAELLRIVYFVPSVGGCAGAAGEPIATAAGAGEPRQGPSELLAGCSRVWLRNRTRYGLGLKSRNFYIFPECLRVCRFRPKWGGEYVGALTGLKLSFSRLCRSIRE